MSTLLAILGKIRYKHDRVWSDYIDSARVLMDSYTRIKWVEFGFDEGTNQYTIPPSLILLDMYWDCDKKTLVSYWVLRSLWRHVANIVTYRHNFMAFSNKQYLSRGKWGFSRNGLHYLPLETTRSEVTPGNKVILFDEILSIFDCNGAMYKKTLWEQYIWEQKSCVCDHL